MAIIFTIILGISDTKENIIGCKVFKKVKHTAVIIIAFIKLIFRLLPYPNLSGLISFFKRSLCEKKSPSLSSIK